jgi:ABC-type bacteriocin/lantibiotic exporter with double-glycine peptidase domain
VPETRDGPRYREAAVARRRSPETSGTPLETPLRRTRRAVLRAVLSALAAVVAPVRRLAHRDARTLRYVPQVEASDCGAACLATVLGHHGLDIPVSELRHRLNLGRSGTSALSMLRVARSYGLTARGVRTDVGGLDHLPPGTVLHWNLDHFVVLAGSAGSRGIRIVDPALGYRDVPRRVVDSSFSGIALVFEGTRSQATAPPVRRSPLRAWAHVLPLLREPRLFRSITIAGLVSQALVLSFPFVLRYVLDSVVPNDHLSAARRIGFFVVPLLVVQVAVFAVRAVTLSWLRARVDFRLSRAILDKMLSLPYAFLQRRSTGDLLLRVRATTALRHVFTTAVLSGIVDGLTALSLFAVVAVLDARLALAAFAVVLVQVLVLVTAWHSQWQLTLGGLEAQALSQARLVEVLTGAETLKIAGAEHETVDVWAQLLADETNWEIQRSVAGGVTDALLQALRLVAPVMLVVIGAVEVLNGRTGTGSMVAAASLAVAALTPITTMLSTAFQLATVRAHLDRINDLFDEPSDAQGSFAPSTTAGAVRLDGVTFTYPGAREPTLRDIDLSIEAGSCVAVVGTSGSGKSTLAMLLSGLHHPDSGRVLLDGVPLGEYTHAARRGLLGFVPQDPHFFGGTIRENVTLFRDFPDDDVLRALELAHVLDDVARLQLGVDTVLAESGKSLSGGQLQRLGLARALLMLPRVLVLDETTSALDAVAESVVLDHVLGLGITTIVITHRESVAARADRVVRVVDGVLVQATSGDGDR